MALRSRLITDPREVLRIMDNMSDDDNLSNEEDSAFRQSVQDLESRHF